MIVHRMEETIAALPPDCANRMAQLQLMGWRFEEQNSHNGYRSYRAKFEGNALMGDDTSDLRRRFGALIYSSSTLYTLLDQMYDVAPKMHKYLQALARVDDLPDVAKPRNLRPR